MKRLLIITMCLFFLCACGGRTYKGGSGTNGNPNKLEKSPCAGCFGADEKKQFHIEDPHVS